MKQKIIIIVLAVIAAIAAVIIWLKTKGDGNGYTEGDSKCEGFDLYTYTNGQWVLTQAESSLCEWAPGDAIFEFSNLQITPSSCKTGDSVVIEVTVTNVGGKTGTKVVTLEIT